ncbi:MAG: UTP--glucose-1-phosphate uridylyltransferase [bacterium]
MTIPDPQEHKLIRKAEEAGQNHVFRFWNELNDASRKKLLKQIQNIDFTLLDDLHRRVIQNPVKNKGPFRFQATDFISLPKTPEERVWFREAHESGEKALQAGRVAVLLVAGGQASRLGFDGPKGVFPISPIKQKSFFQLYAETLTALTKRYGSALPWYIMTSPANHSQTLDFFERHDFFKLEAKNVFFFQQEMIPALSPDGRLFLDAKDHIFTNPNGHGGALSGLRKSGALADMRQRGIDLIFYFQVDNVLAKICDPVFLGFHIQENAHMSAKIVRKRDAQEKLGVFGKIDGRLGVIEYSDLPEEEKNARKPDGELKYSAGNIAVHILDLAFIEKVTEKGLNLPWHAAHKKISHLNAAGNLIEPDTPNGYKFETFIFDAFQNAERAVMLEVVREHEFSPVKNAQGLDSPETAKRDLVNVFGAWLEHAGIAVPRDAQNNVQGLIEISPLFALDQEDFKNRSREMQFTGKLYLE